MSAYDFYSRVVKNHKLTRSKTRSLTHGAKYKFIAELRRPFAEHYKYRNRTTCMQRNRNQYNSSFFMVNMASGMDCGRVRPKTTTSHNMAAIQLIPSHAVLVYRLCYWTSMLWFIDSCQSKVSADRYHVTYRGLKFTAHRGRVFFEVDRWQSTGFLLDRGLKLG